MKKILAIDIGIDNIKAILGWKNDKNIIKGETFFFQYKSSISNAVDIAYLDFKNFYAENRQIIQQTLLELFGKINDKPQLYFTFNSLFSKVYPKTLEATSKKKLKIAANVLIEKVSQDDFITDYQIIDNKKDKNLWEVLIYSYNRRELDSLVTLLSEINIKPKVIDFDALCIASVLESVAGENENRLLINIGNSKTTIIYIENKVLKEFRVINSGIFEIFRKLSYRYQITINEAKDRILADDDQFMKISDMNTEDILLPFINKIKILLTEYPLDKIDTVDVCGSITLWKKFMDLLSQKLPIAINIFPEDFPGADIEFYGYLPVEFVKPFGLLMRGL